MTFSNAPFGRPWQRSLCLQIVQSNGRLIVGETGLVFAFSFAAVDPFGITIPAGAGEAAVEGRGLVPSPGLRFAGRASLPFPIHAFSGVFTGWRNPDHGGGCRGFISQLPLRRSRSEHYRVKKCGNGFHKKCSEVYRLRVGNYTGSFHLHSDPLPEGGCLLVIILFAHQFLQLCFDGFCPDGVAFFAEV